MIDRMYDERERVCEKENTYNTRKERKENLENPNAIEIGRIRRI
jgi:hypothetical protein